MQNVSFLKVVTIYIIIVMSVLLWSGSNQEKSIYDKYLITFRGVEIKVNDISLAKLLLSEYLEFDIKSETDTELNFILPDKRLISIVKYPNKEQVTNQNPSIILINVKNGISPLHQRLKQKLTTNVELTQSASISEIVRKNGKTEFLLKGPEGLNFVFSQKVFFAQ